MDLGLRVVESLIVKNKTIIGLKYISYMSSLMTTSLKIRL